MPGSSEQDAPDSDRVTLLPPQPAPVIEPRRIPLWQAVPGLWFRPDTVGPHLAAGPWTPAIFVHLFSVAIATWCWGMAVLLNDTPLGMPAGTAIVSALTDLPRILRSIPQSAEEIALLLATCLTVELAVVGVTVSLMPWAAAGERMSALWNRCLKLTLWASSMMVPVSLVILATMLLPMWLESDTVGLWFDVLPDDELWRPTLAAIASLLWAGSALLRASVHYAGPAQGPGWEPIEPVCRGCGYSLRHLSLAGRCPECGDAVAKSMPDEKWSRAGPARQLLAVVFARPLKTARPRSEMKSAQTLVVGGYARACFLIVTVAMVVFLTFSSWLDLEELISWALGTNAILCLGLALWFAKVMALGFFWSWWTDRRRDPRVAAVVGMYCTALLQPIVWLNVGGLLLLYLATMFLSLQPFVALPILGEVYTELVLLGAYVVLNCTLLGWLLYRMYRHVNDVRYCDS